jgi:hypothetical protein
LTAIVCAIGDTPIMRLRKMTYAHGIRAGILAKLADVINASTVQYRADIGQYRHRPRFRRRLARLSPRWFHHSPSAICRRRCSKESRHG